MSIKLKFKILLLAATVGCFGMVWLLFIMTQVGFGVASGDFALRGPANQVRTVYSYACNDGTSRRVGSTAIANALSELGCIGRGGVLGVRLRSTSRLSPAMAASSSMAEAKASRRVIALRTAHAIASGGRAFRRRCACICKWALRATG